MILFSVAQVAKLFDVHEANVDTTDLADQTDSTSVDNAGTKAQHRSLVLTHKGYASLDPTTRAGWLVKAR